MLVSKITNQLMKIIPCYAVSSAAAYMIKKYIKENYLSNTKVWYSCRTARHNTLPGFYQKLYYTWYADSSRTKVIGTSIVYRYKA